MENLGRFTFALLGMLAGTSFTSHMVEDKAMEFTVNGTAKYSIEASIDSAYYGNYRITEHHQLGIDRFIMDDGKDAVLLSDYSTGRSFALRAARKESDGSRCVRYPA